MRVKQVECQLKSLNSGDVFVLDLEDTIYQWNGSGASRMEKGKGLDLTTRLRDERGAKANVVIIEEKENDPESAHPQFWKALGGKGAVPAAEAAGDDAEWEKTAVKVRCDCIFIIFYRSSYFYHLSHYHYDYYDLIIINFVVVVVVGGGGGGGGGAHIGLRSRLSAAGVQAVPCVR